MSFPQRNSAFPQRNFAYPQRNSAFPHIPIPRQFVDLNAEDSDERVLTSPVASSNTTGFPQRNSAFPSSALSSSYAEESSPSSYNSEEEIDVPNAYEPELNRSNYIGIIDGHEEGREMGFESPISINSIRSIVGYNPFLPRNLRWFVKPAPGSEIPHLGSFEPIYVANKDILIAEIGSLYNSLPMEGGRRKRSRRSKKSKKYKKSKKNKTSKKSRKSKR